MKLSFMTSATFNQNPSRAKKEANQRPLVITEHGEASYVLVRYSDFEANWRKPKNLLEALRDPAPSTDADFEPDRINFDRRDVEF